MLTVSPRPRGRLEPSAPRAGSLRAWLSALALVLAVTGCSRDPAALLAEARRLHQNGDRTEAIIQLKNALQQDPKLAEARFLLGVLHNETRDGRSAEKELRRALELGMIEGGRVQAELGRALLLDNRFRQLLKEINPSPAFEANPLATIYAVRGHAYLRIRQPKEAFAMHAAAVKADPANPDVAVLGATLQLAQRRVDDAVRTVEQVVAAHPRNLDALILLADLNLLRGNHDAAFKVYGSLLALDPRSVLALGARATLYARLGKTAEAQKDIDTMRKTARGSALAHYLQGFVHLRNGKYREAQASAQESLRRAPEYRPAQYLFGVSSYAIGAFAQAEQMFAKLLAAEPNNANVRKMYAATLIEIRQGRRALEVIEPMFGKDIQDSAALALAGDAAMRSGDYARATEYMERAVEMRPQDPELRVGLAASRLGVGDLERTVEELETAAGVKGGSRRAEFMLVMTQLRAKQFDKAVEAARALEKKEPKNPIVHHLLGLAWLGKQDAAAARKSFERALAVNPAYLPSAIRLANLDVKDNDRAAARKRFEGVLAADKTNVAAMIALAEATATARRLSPEGVDWLERARKTSAPALVPRVMLVRHYLEVRDPQKALPIAQEAVNAHPANPDALDVLGAAQLASGEINASLATYQKLAASAPNHPVSYLRLGLAQLEARKIKEAETSLRKALALRPDYGEARVALSTVLIYGKRHTEAMAIAKQAQKEHPRSALGYILEADALGAQKKYAEAVALYDKALGMEKSSATAVKLYVSQVGAGSRDAAIARLKQWVTENPADFNARMVLADGQLQTGDPRGAAANLEAVLARYPGDVLVLNNLATAYHQMKDKRARDTAEKAHKLRPDNPLVLDTYAWILLEEGGKASQAVELLRTAARRAPKVPTIRYHLAVAYLKAGDKAGARRELEDILGTNQPFPERAEARNLLSKL